MRSPHAAFTAVAAALTLALAACSDTGTPFEPQPASELAAFALVGGTGTAAQLSPQLASDKCLDVWGGSKSAGTPIALYGCHSGANQKYSWRSTGEIRVYDGTMCVDAASGLGRDGDPIIIWTCNGGPNQKWTASSASEIKGINGKCVALVNGGTSSGTRLVLATCNGSSAQKWNTVGSTSSSPTTDPAPTESTTTTPIPSDAIAIYPGESIQSKVNAAGAGAKFVLKAGTHRRQSVVPKSGNVFVGEAGAVMDGEKAVAYAFYHGSSPYPTNVQIKGLVIKNYVPAIPWAAIRAGGHSAGDGAAGWVIENNEIAYNSAGGIRIASGMKVLGNKIHHNSWIGLIGAGNNILVENNEISYHNIDGTVDRAAFGAGGTKFVYTDGLVVRGNFSHHNNGPGFWTDLNNINTIYENNRVEDNVSSGIFHEISYKVIIRNNTVARNGFGDGWLYGGGITISASPNAEIYGNTVIDNRNGITGVQQVRDEPASYGAHELNNMYVHDNKVYMAKSKWTGLGIDVSDASSYFTSRNNRFVNNTYYLGTNQYPFHWSNPFTNENMWRQQFGQDLTGTFYR